MSGDPMNDEELTAAWLKAEAELYSAQIEDRSARSAEVQARNQLSAARRAEEVAWKALEAHRLKIVNGGTP